MKHSQADPRRYEEENIIALFIIKHKLISIVFRVEFNAIVNLYVIYALNNLKLNVEVFPAQITRAQKNKA